MSIAVAQLLGDEPLSYLMPNLPLPIGLIEVCCPFVLAAAMLLRTPCLCAAVFCCMGAVVVHTVSKVLHEDSAYLLCLDSVSKFYDSCHTRRRVPHLVHMLLEVVVHLLDLLWVPFSLANKEEQEGQRDKW